MSRSPRVDDRKPLGYVVGGLGMLAVALVLVPFRTEIDNANLALLLVVVVVLAAIVGDRSAAVLAAITATVCFDFFLDPSVHVDAYRKRRRHRDGRHHARGRAARR